MALTDIKVRTTKPSDKPFKLTDGQGMHLLINPMVQNTGDFNTVSMANRKF